MSGKLHARVIGGGGHGKVVVSTLLAAGYEVHCVLDDDPARWGQEILGVRIAGPTGAAADSPDVPTVIGIGGNAARKKIAQSIRCNWLGVIHPHAFVHPSARVEGGAVVFAGAIVQPEAVVGAHAILNTGVTVDHDCVIADFVHLAPGVHLAGGVRLGEGAFLGVGCSVIPYRGVGAWSVIGAGGVVVEDIPDRSLAVGVPARRIKEIV